MELFIIGYVAFCMFLMYLMVVAARLLAISFYNAGYVSVSTITNGMSFFKYLLFLAVLFVPVVNVITVVLFLALGANTPQELIDRAVESGDYVKIAEE